MNESQKVDAKHDTKPEAPPKHGFLFVDLHLMSPRLPDDELQKRFYALVKLLGKEGWVTSQVVQTHSESLGGRAKAAEKK